MTRFLLKITSLLLLVFAALNVTARAVGTLQPPNPMLAGFTIGCEGQPGACWYGIVPGETTVREARAVLSYQNYRFMEATGWPGRAFMRYQSANGISNCEEGLFDAVNNDYIDNFNLSECAELTAGDLISLFGTPVGVCIYYASFGLMFTYEKGAVIVMLKDSPRFSPFTPVELVYLTPDSGKSLMGWLGFKSERLYNRLYPPPNNTVCY
ncbi:MAG TPA: hypothetical protein VHO69_01525 [Phototrophicaceae bacterium]|nr:hypothetical protein [Phototrophicaceae bacterium]